MSVVELRTALDTLEEASCCSGKVKLTERFALALPEKVAVARPTVSEFTT